MRRLSFSSLRFRLVLLVVVAILPALALMMYDATARHAIMRSAMIAGVALLLAVVAGWVGADVVVLSTVNRLLTVTRRVADGQLGARTGIRRGTGEIERLAGAFDDMASTLEARQRGRQEAEDALRETNETLRALIQASPLAIVVADPEGRVTVWNPAAAAMFQTSEAEAIGHPCAPLASMLDQVLRGDVVRGVPASLPGDDGAALDVTISAAPLVHANGEIRGSMAVVADVTEHRRLEAELVRSQKTEAVGRLAGGIAHDFNNLLTVIIGRAERVLARFGGDPALRRETEIMLRTAQRAARLTQQLLAFSRKQRLEPRVLDLNAVVAEMHRMLRHLIGEHLELVTLLRATPATVRADPGQLEQVIVNLVLNARDAMAGSGRLTIETANEAAAPVAALPPGRYVVLEVSDTGSGMDAETLAHIFEPFFSTKRQGQGTGLGLATVQGIVKQSGGEIVVESRPRHGTRFRIYLPAADDVAEGSEPEWPQPTTRGWETLLLVEDETEVRTVARETLQGQGYVVLEAGDGEEAVHLADSYHDPIHLLVVDMVMPRMGGAEAARQVARRRPGTRVLYMSGYAGDAREAHGDRLEPGSFLAKPFTPHALARKVREVLDA